MGKSNPQLFDNSEYYFTANARMMSKEYFTWFAEMTSGYGDTPYVTEFWLTDEYGQTFKCGETIYANDEEQAKEIMKARGLEERICGKLVLSGDNLE